MFVDLWGWFRRYESQAYHTGDKLKQRMFDLSYAAWEYRRQAEGEKAIQAFDEALKIASILKEPCWEVFYLYWINVIRLYIYHDYSSSLDNAVRLVVEVQKEQYQDCPIKGRVLYMLLKIYFMLDFYGYEEEILKLLAYLEKEVSIDEDTYLQILGKHAEIDIIYKRYDTARAKLQNNINRAANQAFRLYDAYQDLRKIAFAEGDLTAALEYNRIAQRYAEEMQLQYCIADERFWEALFLKYLGDEQQARSKYYAVLAYYQQGNLPLETVYYHVQMNYLELDAQSDTALKLAETYLQVVKARPSISDKMDMYYSYIALLGRSGKDISEALAEAKAVAQSSLKPAPHLERLLPLEAGNYFEYDWQKQYRTSQS